MSIGYACLTVGVPNTKMSRCIEKNATESRLFELIQANLKALHCILDYNIANNIRLFRISSDLIPFGSSPVNTLDWWNMFDAQFQMLGDIIAKNGLRVSMHPGQYTVLNSTNEEVVSRAILDLEYHTKVLNCLRTEKSHKIILHIGGIYGDKQQAIQRFLNNYRRLPQDVKHRLVIENDDKLYPIQDVLSIGNELRIPVVFDNLHHKILGSPTNRTEFDWIRECKSTWTKLDGQQKIHYAQQDIGKKPGAHSETIEVEEFLAFYQELGREDIDIMLEVKDKNVSAVKCIRSIEKEKDE